jgi:CubicO group peptidase (beta-lactamase class C family)
MDRWLGAALDYIPRWLEFQMQASQQPGCIVAIAHRDKVVLERAFGSANLDTGEALTPRHRFRIASHTKSFTAAAILKLRERGKLKLDDTAGQFVSDLHPGVARATIAQLLSHSAGLIRDGRDAGQFLDRRAFLNARELKEDLKLPPVIDAGSRLKYSNHGYALLGLIIEAITGESWAEFIKREIIDAVGLKETTPDMPLKRGTPFARGHTGRILLGRRLVIPGDFVQHAVAPAGSVVSTASDVARYFAQLSPNARRSVISTASRREMTRRHWRNPNSSLEDYYGLGTMSGTMNGWDWFGHGGGLQGYISQTRVYPAQELTVVVLTNAIDGWAGMWVGGITNILQAFARNGAPSRKVRDWNGRFWTLWGASDLVPMGNKVVWVAPGMITPMADAGELTVMGRNLAKITLTNGYGSYGEMVRCVRNKSGRITELIGATRILPAARVAREMEKRYSRPSKRRQRSRSR